MIDNSDKVSELREKLDKAILPVVDRDYVYLDLPYHPNTGDGLIWSAAHDMLSQSGHKCLYESSEFTFDDRNISADTLIIFNGGGNFGDLWYNYTVFRNKIINKYPENHFLVLPQSVCYESEQHLREDIEIYSQCKNMTICSRDQASYDFLRKHFTKNDILLTPDMAFHTSKKLLQPKNNDGKVLFLKRIDKEFVPDEEYNIVPKNAEVHDWPTLEGNPYPYKALRKLMGCSIN